MSAAMRKQKKRSKKDQDTRAWMYLRDPEFRECVDTKQQRAQMNGLREQVADRWQETFAAAGLSESGIDLLAPSFGL